jgi:lipopolysaccharide/colanic/teichoic acid biosynthesis glycosyltransferase
MPSSRPARVERVPAPDGAVPDLVLADGVGGAGELDLLTMGAAGGLEHASHAGGAHVGGGRPGFARTGFAGAALARRREGRVLEAHVWADSPARTGTRAALKRAVDVFGAVVGLVLAVPLMLLLAPLIWVTSPGPVLFSHTRLGRDGRPFQCYKLRTMCADAESHLASDPALRAAYRANGYKLPSHADRRVTRLGRFMRLSSLDELPQFWNVLRGDMSLVGPRPIVGEELEHYDVRDRRLLLSVRPGITGAWAVGGRSRVGYPRRGQLELDYVRGWSLGRDFVILFQTAGAVLGRRGAS